MGNSKSFSQEKVFKGFDEERAESVLDWCKLGVLKSGFGQKNFWEFWEKLAMNGDDWLILYSYRGRTEGAVYAVQ